MGIEKQKQAPTNAELEYRNEAYAVAEDISREHLNTIFFTDVSRPIPKSHYPLDHPEFVPPEPDEVSAVVAYLEEQANYSKNAIARLLGAKKTGNEGRNISSWATGKYAVPLTAWRLMLVYAGLAFDVNRIPRAPQGYKAWKKMEPFYMPYNANSGVFEIDRLQVIGCKGIEAGTLVTETEIQDIGLSLYKMINGNLLIVSTIPDTPSKYHMHFKAMLDDDGSYELFVYDKLRSLELQQLFKSVL